ncbi:short-chain dehydrogenase [Evansella tamaricis]|uniref:Short-chain dehydrogenase n=1 Tax=Evansella tamaricis TaxID=2069301 RepID=A0ABS6JLG7_9BACI|nr:short-chain dehydrogenase [Evansella tamaricis]MBU9713692.1 short-chain dehydrogenase [Evansella tamaricis]
MDDEIKDVKLGTKETVLASLTHSETKLFFQKNVLDEGKEKPAKSHVLVVGGTGMLARTSLWLVEQGYHVSIIARNKPKMEVLLKKASNPENITPIYIDYKDNKLLEMKLKESMIRNGDISLAVVWIHSVAKEAIHTIIHVVSQSRRNWNLYHVLGSSTNLAQLKENLKVPYHCTYHQIKLGFQLENTYSRWLTHEEISQGVIDTIRNGKLDHIVGVIEPWEKRP